MKKFADESPYSQSYGAITDSMNMSLSQLREIAKDREASWGHKDHDQIMGSQKSVTEQQRFFQQSGTDVRVEPLRRLSGEELMHLNCGAEEDS